MSAVRLNYASVARVWSCLFVVFGSVDCSQHMCDDWACVNQTHLNGSVTIPEQVTTVDVQLCTNGICRSGSLDLRDTDSPHCVALDGTICLTEAADLHTFELSTTWDIEFGVAPHDTTAKIVLTDQASGQVILDETRTAKWHFTVNDECHQCFGAEATL